MGGETERERRDEARVGVSDREGGEEDSQTHTRTQEVGGGGGGGETGDCAEVIRRHSAGLRADPARPAQQTRVERRLITHRDRAARPDPSFSDFSARLTHTAVQLRTGLPAVGLGRFPSQVLSNGAGLVTAQCN